MTFTHDDIQERLIDFLYGELDGEARAAFEEHIGACDRCRSEVNAFEQTRATARAIVRAPLADALPAATRARVMETVAHATAERAAANKTPASKPAAHDPRVVSRWSAWLRSRWTLPMFATVAAMGALLLVRETVFREARRPLGENSTRDLAPKPAPAIPPTENPVPVGPAGEPPRFPDLKGVPAKRRRSSAAASSRNAAPVAVEPKVDQSAHPAQPRQDDALERAFDNSAGFRTRREEGRLSRGAPPPTAALSRDVPAKSAANALETERDMAASSAVAPSSASSGGAASTRDPVAAQVERAETFMATQRWNDAIVAYRELLRRFPRHASAPVWRRQLVAAQAAAQGAAARDNPRFATPPPPR